MNLMTKQQAMDALRGKCIALIRFDDFETAKLVSHAVAQAGIGAIEITFTVKDAPRLIRELNEEFGDNVLVGAGTVLSGSQAELARENGADFITSPCILPEVGTACKRLNMMCSMGAGTVNEAYQSYLAGSDLIKLFPGSSIDPDFIRAVRAPLPFAVHADGRRRLHQHRRLVCQRRLRRGHRQLPDQGHHPRPSGGGFQPLQAAAQRHQITLFAKKRGQGHTTPSALFYWFASSSTAALQPMRSQPAAQNCSIASRVRMPPAALIFTPAPM